MSNVVRLGALGPNDEYLNLRCWLAEVLRDAARLAHEKRNIMVGAEGCDAWRPDRAIPEWIIPDPVHASAQSAEAVAAELLEYGAGDDRYALFEQLENAVLSIASLIMLLRMMEPHA
ncbi:hypothetical protein [Acidocella sp.]|uniref:hypothetical protein n=1 Tax=Acidocella sp. TaxID=50710 RepID=UPI00261E973A|nr:hypothetical protein [Acidocella sp.]